MKYRLFIITTLVGVFMAVNVFAAYDATGIWNYTESALWHNGCPSTPYALEPAGQAGVLQTGSTFLILGDGFSTEGTVNNTTYTFYDKWRDFYESTPVDFNSSAIITLTSLTAGTGSVTWDATWDGGGCSGGHTVSFSRPAVVPPVHDATGRWNFTQSQDNNLDSCGGGNPPTTGYFDVTQTGNKITAVNNLGHHYDGFVSGTQYAVLRTYM